MGFMSVELNRAMKLSLKARIALWALAVPTCTVVVSNQVEDRIVLAESERIVQSLGLGEPISMSSKGRYTGGTHEVTTLAAFVGDAPSRAEVIEKLKSLGCEGDIVPGKDGTWLSSRAVGPVDSWYVIGFSRREAPNWLFARSWLMD